MKQSNLSMAFYFKSFRINHIDDRFFKISNNYYYYFFQNAIKIIGFTKKTQNTVTNGPRQTVDGDKIIIRNEKKKKTVGLIWYKI